jgi:hypothetical protein
MTLRKVGFFQLFDATIARLDEWGFRNMAGSHMGHGAYTYIA